MRSTATSSAEEDPVVEAIDGSRIIDIAEAAAEAHNRCRSAAQMSGPSYQPDVGFDQISPVEREAVILPALA